MSINVCTFVACMQDVRVITAGFRSRIAQPARDLPQKVK